MGNRTLASASRLPDVVVWRLIIPSSTQIVVYVEGSGDDKAPYVYFGPPGAPAIEQSRPCLARASTPGGYGPLGGVVAVDRPSLTQMLSKVDPRDGHAR